MAEFKYYLNPVDDLLANSTTCIIIEWPSRVTRYYIYAAPRLFVHKKSDGIKINSVDPE
jgi:hypothetical protein